MSHKSYSVILVGLLLLLLATVAAFNWTVDPYWYFRDVEIRGFNLDKPHAHANERLVKSALLLKLQPEAVVLGSSFAEIGLPVSHRGFNESGKLKPFNMAMAGALAPELYCYAMFALAQPGLKRMVLGGFGTQANSCADFHNLGSVDYTKLLLSKTVLDHSWDTLLRQDGKPELTAEGMWFYNRFNRKIRNDRDVMQAFAWDMRHGMCKTPVKNRAFDALRIDKSKPPTDESTAGLRRIIRIALQKNIHLVLISFPKHVLYYERNRECGGLEAYWSSLWRIASIVEEEAGADSHVVELWDFYAYRGINSERLHAGIPMSKRLWQDSGHFNQEVGQVVFDAIFKAESAYGRRVTTRSFDQMVADSENERKKFMTRNPWVQQEMDELLVLERLNLPSL